MKENNILTPEEIYASEREWLESTILQKDFVDLNSFLHHVAQTGTSEVGDDSEE